MPFDARKLKNAEPAAILDIVAKGIKTVKLFGALIPKVTSYTTIYRPAVLLPRRKLPVLVVLPKDIMGFESPVAYSTKRKAIKAVDDYLTLVRATIEADAKPQDRETRWAINEQMRRLGISPKKRLTPKRTK